jgi:hypothetical protein
MKNPATSLEQLVDRVERIARHTLADRIVVFFVDFSGSMSNQMLEAAFALVQEYIKDMNGQVASYGFGTNQSKVERSGNAIKLDSLSYDEWRALIGGGSFPDAAIAQAKKDFGDDIWKILVGDLEMMPSDLAKFDEQRRV